MHFVIRTHLKSLVLALRTQVSLTVMMVMSVLSIVGLGCCHILSTAMRNVGVPTVQGTLRTSKLRLLRRLRALRIGKGGED